MARATRAFRATAAVVLLLMLATTVTGDAAESSGRQRGEVAARPRHAASRSLLHSLEGMLGLAPAAER